jgi:hypothetical protein
VATVAVIAGGAIGATHVIDHETAPRRHRAAAPVVPEPSLPVAAPVAATLPVFKTTPQQHRSAVAGRRRPGRRNASSTPVARTSSPQAPREPGGFAYLGVPHESSSTPLPAPARAASGGGGGQFSP